MNQREIKFRYVWKTKEGLKIHEFSLDEIDRNITTKLCGKYGSLPIVKLQFTNLKDKNGKSIFEGDIVRSRVDAGTEDYENWRDLDEEVYFGGGAFYPVSMADTTKEYEVIGNIWENPELLK